MAIPVLIIGDSGLGKTHSLRSLPPSQTLLIQSTPKRLPFRSLDWKNLSRENPDGSVYCTDDYSKIHRLLDGANNKGKSKIIIDDANYLMMNEELRRSEQTGYAKYVQMAKNFIGIVDHAQHLDGDARVYFMMHTQSDANGIIKPKTTGKMIDEKVVLEGLFTIVLRVHCVDGRHFFTTKTNGSDPVKTPVDMFDNNEIDNDLLLVDNAIKDFYGLEY